MPQQGQCKSPGTTAACAYCRQPPASPCWRRATPCSAALQLHQVSSHSSSQSQTRCTCSNVAKGTSVFCRSPSPGLEMGRDRCAFQFVLLSGFTFSFSPPLPALLTCRYFSVPTQPGTRYRGDKPSVDFLPDLTIT